MGEKLLDNGDQYLPEQYIKYCDNLQEDSEVTWDDFFDHVNLSSDKRSDFLIAAIYKQALETLSVEVDYQI